MYDPMVGRFLTEDPSDFDGGDANLYRYCGNNPLTNIDPSGLCFTGVFGAISKAVGNSVSSYNSAVYNAASSAWNAVRPTVAQTAVNTVNWGMSASRGLQVNGSSTFNTATDVSYTGPLFLATLYAHSLLSNPIANESMNIGSWLPGVSDSAYLHLTSASNSQLASGVWAESSWVMKPDVANMTVPKYKSDVVMKLADAYGPGANNFVVVEPTNPGYTDIVPEWRAYNNNNIAGVQEYANMVDVQPSTTVKVPRMAAASEQIGAGIGLKAGAKTFARKVLPVAGVALVARDAAVGSGVYETGWWEKVLNGGQTREEAFSPHSKYVSTSVTGLIGEAALNGYVNGLGGLIGMRGLRLAGETEEEHANRFGHRTLTTRETQAIRDVQAYNQKHILEIMQGIKPRELPEIPDYWLQPDKSGSRTLRWKE